MIAVEMRDDHPVDLLGGIAGIGDRLDQTPLGEPPGTVAGVEENELLAGVHEQRREGDLHAARRQEVLLGIGRDGLGRLVVAEDRVGPVELDRAVEQGRNLEIAELETIEGGPRRAQHRRRGTGRAGGKDGRCRKSRRDSQGGAGGQQGVTA
ncbi:MAG: hypothetical protein R3C69_17245 [Geminicoccaceae bacterium]